MYVYHTPEVQLTLLVLYNVSRIQGYAVEDFIQFTMLNLCHEKHAW